jgi:glycosyltransferase involved in cell wall biosynthesis
MKTDSLNHPVKAKPTPLVSVVLCSFNQGKYLEECLLSLLGQDYENLEIILQDGGSTDETVQILEKYRKKNFAHLKIFVEKDHGQADGLNRGFARTSGEILGFLNSDDILHPGAIRHISNEINPSQHRFVVMGRCVFFGENHRYVGLEHPSRYCGRHDLLTIWKRGFNTIPQPATFWHREVWKTFPEFDTKENHALDYDYFCRITSKYWIHKIDHLLAGYRIHDESKSGTKTEQEVLALSIRVSRKHWGPWFDPGRWRLELSHARYRAAWRDRALHYSHCLDRISSNSDPRKYYYLFLTSIFSQKLAWNKHIKPRIFGKWLAPMLQRVLLKKAIEDFSEQYADGWIGPVFRIQLQIPQKAKTIRVEFEVPQTLPLKRLSCFFKLNGKLLLKISPNRAGLQSVNLQIPTGNDGSKLLEINTNKHFVPSEINKEIHDDRKLSLMVKEILFNRNY